VRARDAAELLGNLGECPCKGMKCKAYHVSSWRNGDRTEDHIGLQDLSRLAVHGCSPPWMPDIIEKQNTARGRLDIDVDLRCASYPSPSFNEFEHVL
jgi:hypothetical protein